MIPLRLKHWWQRNFGHVWATRGGSDDGWYKFRARFGKIALVWTTFYGDLSFICFISSDHKVRIAGKEYPGYGQQYGWWHWDYEPHGKVLGKGGNWW